MIFIYNRIYVCVCGTKILLYNAFKNKDYMFI